MSHLVRFPWDKKNPIRVEVLRLGETRAVVRTIDPAPGQTDGPWPARTEWLEETP